MATSAPKMPSVGALSLMGMTGQSSVYDDPRLDSMIGTLSQAFGDKDQNEKDEQLAFAGGMSNTGGHADMGSALMGGYKAQSEQRTKNKELMGQYMPTIMNTIIAQKTAQQSQMMLQAMMGPGGGGWIQRVSEQFGIAPEAIQADLLTNEGKGIREMIFKNSTPEYIMQDGAMIDKNPYTNGMYAASRQQAQVNANPGQGPVIGTQQRSSQEGQDERRPGSATAGSMSPFSWTPGITQSASGNAMMRYPDPTAPGGIAVGAPKGGAESSKMYGNIAAETQANWDPQTIQPRGGNPIQTTRGNIVRQINTPMEIGGTQATGAVPPQAPAGTQPTPTNAAGHPQVPAAEQAARDKDAAGALGGELSTAIATLAKQRAQLQRFQNAGLVEDAREMEEELRRTSSRIAGLQDQMKVQKIPVPAQAVQPPGQPAPVTANVNAPQIVQPQVGGELRDQPPANDVPTLRAQLIDATDRRDVVRMNTIKQKIDQLTGTKPTIQGIELASEAEKAGATKAADAAQTQTTANLQEKRKAETAVQKYDEALGVLQGTTKPTHSGFGAGVDRVGAFFGKAPSGMDEAQQLKVIGGWLVNNVPRMEGPQSNFDREGYEQMAGLVNNDQLPISARIKAAKTARQMIIDSAPKEFGSDFKPYREPSKTSGSNQAVIDAARAELARRGGK